MTQTRIMIDDRTYEKWSFQHIQTNVEIDANVFPDVNPSNLKLFTKDILDTTTNTLIYSPTRTSPAIAGVLQLDSGKTFGRTANKKKLLYKCIPNDRYLPIFLVPYEIKTNFSKSQKNKYVIFRFDQWKDKHPHGILCETLGDVDNLDAFYEYQLYSRSIHSSISEITTNARRALKQKSVQEYVEQITKNPTFQIQDRTQDRIFTIDPHNSLDFDDGFSIKQDDNITIVSIYIANVYVWLETLGLWNSFSQRVATIYLPEYRRPMLPTVLSDALCSLQEREDRFAFVMDIPIDIDGNIIENQIQFSNAKIRVFRNYRYEEANLMQDVHYQSLANITQKMESCYQNSHDIVAFWMVHMNTYCAKFLENHKCGIFRSVTYNHNECNLAISSSNISSEAQRVIKMWNNTTGQYIVYSGEESMKHDLLQLTTYAHVTSPIRRLVDLLNYMFFFKKIMGLTISKDAEQFMSNWIHIDRMEYINTSMRSIRKVQTDCDLLYRCNNAPEIMSVTHSGIVFDRMVRSNGSISYMVYLEKWKLLSRITVPCQYTGGDLPNYTEAKFNIFLFEDENKVHKKIRLQLVE